MEGLWERIAAYAADESGNALLPTVLTLATLAAFGYVASVIVSHVVRHMIRTLGGLG